MSVGRKFCLTQISGPNLAEGRRGAPVALSAREMVVGRSERADVEIAVPTVSREHAAVWATAKGAYARDLGSGHGTFVNSVQVNEAKALQQGDLLALGQDIVFLVGVVQGAEFDSIEGAALSETQVMESSLVELALADVATADVGTFFDAACDLDQIANSTEDERQLIGLVVDGLRQYMLSDRLLGFLGDSSEQLTLAAQSARSPELAAEFNPPSRSILRRGFLSKNALISFDAQQDPRFKDKKSVAMSNVRSTISAPLQTPDGPVGVLYADAATRTGVHDRNDGRLMQLAGSLVGRRIYQLRLSAHFMELSQRFSAGKDPQMDAVASLVHSHLNRVELMADHVATAHKLKGPARLIRAESKRLRDDLDPFISWGKRDLGQASTSHEAQVIVAEDFERANPLSRTVSAQNAILEPPTDEQMLEDQPMDPEEDEVEAEFQRGHTLKLGLPVDDPDQP